MDVLTGIAQFQAEEAADEVMDKEMVQLSILIRFIDKLAHVALIDFRIHLSRQKLCKWIANRPLLENPEDFQRNLLPFFPSKMAINRLISNAKHHFHFKVT